MCLVPCNGEEDCENLAHCGSGVCADCSPIAPYDPDAFKGAVRTRRRVQPNDRAIPRPTDHAAVQQNAASSTENAHTSPRPMGDSIHDDGSVGSKEGGQ